MTTYTLNNKMQIDVTSFEQIRVKKEVKKITVVKLCSVKVEVAYATLNLNIK